MTTVLHVSQPVEEGVGHYVAAVCTGLRERGWDVCVASPTRGLWAEKDPPLRQMLRGSDVPIQPWHAVRSPGLHLWREAADLSEIVRRLDPALIHLHSAKAGLAGRLARPRARRTVFQPHAWSFEAASGPLRWAALAWERRAAARTDAIVCVSEAERVAGIEAGISATWELIPNGVDARRWSAAAPDERVTARATLGLPLESPVAICVGRPSRQKGHDVLIRAWDTVSREVPSASLFFLGDGPERVALAAVSGPTVNFVGNRDDVPTWLAAADVVVLPSRWEGMSLAMLEAMARGRSVVATDVSGAREAVGDTAGCIVAVEDAAGLARAVIERLTDKGLTAREGRAGRARVEEIYNFERVLSQIETLYRKLLQP